MLAVYALAVIGGLVLAAIIGSVLFWAVRRRVKKKLPRQMLLELDLHGGYLERHPDVPPLAKIMGDGGSNIRKLIVWIDRAKDDARVRGMIVRIGAPKIAPAHAQELRDALVRFRDAGKLSVATTDTFGEGGSGNLSYYLATACSEVYVQPSGDVSIMGVRIEQPFVKRALDSLGVQARIGQRHAYKNAPNMFLESGLTEAHRESLTSLAEGVLHELAEGIAQGRKRTPAEVQQWFGDGPFTATEARERGLIDGVLYRDEVYTKVRERLGEDAELIFLDRYGRRSKGAKVKRKAPTVALINGIGGVNRFGGGRGDVFDASEVSAALRAARRDEDVKGVLLRVDSPGGSYVAADTVWREVEATRAAGKPVIVSMVNAAASGGYFVAAPATAVVAQPLTLTGSIGVFGGKVVVRDLAKRFGVDFDGVQTHANADMNSAIVDYTPAQRDKLESQLDRIYDDFTDKVSRGRKMSRDDVHAVAQGRVWTGRQALERKLVDALGGFDTAMSLLKKELGVDPAERIHVREMPGRKSWWDRLRDKPPLNSEREGVETAAGFHLVDAIEKVQSEALQGLVHRVLVSLGLAW
jgi:protease-4